MSGAEAEAADALRPCRAIVALSGAGASTESGLPDFRSAGGIYRRESAAGGRRPEEILSLSCFREDPDLFWSFYRDRLLRLHDAAPNLVHAALRRLEGAGRLRSVVTQNIDGLHQAAGSQVVRELHGNVRTLRCVRGHRRATATALPELRGGRAPRCPRCGAAERPEIVLFEESLDGAVWRRACADMGGCDALVVVGTSLRVAPASSLPEMAAERGVPIVICNREPIEGWAWTRGAVQVFGQAGEAMAGITAALLDP